MYIYMRYSLDSFRRRDYIGFRDKGLGFRDKGLGSKLLIEGRYVGDYIWE